jgi:hypothetical protein
MTKAISPLREPPATGLHAKADVQPHGTGLAFQVYSRFMYTPADSAEHFIFPRACLQLPVDVRASRRPADEAAVRNRVSCYPFGIDKIGHGDRDGRVSIWKGCFAQNFEFSGFIGRGEPTNCPGPSCPFPTVMSAIEMRAAFAKRAFDRGGFVKTSHHLTNLRC